MSRTRKIKFDLSDRSIKEAIQEIEVEINRLHQIEIDIITKLTLTGKLLIMQNIFKYKVIDEGLLMDSIMTTIGKNEGRIWISAPHGVFVEYGTGVVGAGADGDPPHPNKPPDWIYDSTERGESGWVYYDERYGYAWTRGQPAKPFFWDSYLQLRNRAKTIAREELRR